MEALSRLIGQLSELITAWKENSSRCSFNGHDDSGLMGWLVALAVWFKNNLSITDWTASVTSDRNLSGSMFAPV